MANYPKKMKDPTEAALSAIQEALNLQQDEEQAASQPEGMADLLSGPAQSRAPSAPVAPASDEMFDSDAVGSRDLAGPAARAANDDQQSIGQILHALQRRPARSSYFVATAFSAAWIVGCLSLSFAYLSDINAALGPGRSPIALMIGLGAAALLPIIFFFGVAHMAWRSQELRLIAQSMARVAMRLAEPESVARDSIVTVGQAIRREVAAMGDGVERALARASELEALVQNEVAALERTYSDNEVRIRGLLQDLASQRDTLVGQAEQVRSAINNVHVDLTQDLSTISDLVGQQVNEAAQRITQALAERGEHITLTLGQIGDGMVTELSERGGDLLDRLEAASNETSQAISSASERLSSSLDFKTNHISEEFAEIATGLEDMMNDRLDRVAESFSEKSLAVVDLMAGRSQELTDAIVETSSQLAETIAIRGDSLIVDLDLRGSEVANKLQEAGSQLAETLISRSAAMTDEVRESAEHVAGVIATRNDAVKEMLATRLAAFEEMFNHTGAELGERIARDSSTLGNLITRHLAEFDRTVKTYGSELVERLGARTQDVSESMRTYVDSFDNRVTAKANEVTTALDQRLGRFQEALDGRSQTLTDALSARVVDIAKALADGGKEVTAAVDKRISDVTTLIDARAVKLSDTLGERIAKIDSTLGQGALDVANTLDGRIGQLEQLLIGRADAVVHQLELTSRSAADLLNARMEQLSESIKSNSTSAERALSQLAANTTEALGKSAAASMAATETLNRSAAEATVSLNRSAGALSNTITKSATAANETIGKTTTTAADVLAKSAAAANETVGKAMAGAADLLAKSATSANETIGKATATAADLLVRSTQTTSDAIGRSVNEAERKLVGMSTEVSRNLVGKANEIHSAMTQRVDDMTRVLDQNANGLIVALTGKGEQFAGEVSRATDQAVKAIEARGFVFTQTMMDKSEEIARLINDASLNATGTMTRTLGQMQEGAVGVTEAAKLTISRTLEELHRATRGAIEESKQTAAATVAEMMETHTMLRSDSTALFERLREANILLQEVLSGAQENMNSIEHTMAARVSEFVAAMSDLSSKSGATTAKVEQHLGTFNNVTAKVLHDLGDLADQFSSHGRTLADAVELLDSSNRKTDESITARHATIEALVSTLDARTEDFGQRLERFSGLLDESLDTAAARAREIAGIIAESSNEGVQSIEQQYDLVRKTSDEERLRTSEALNSIYDEASAEVQAMFTQSAGRFTEIMEGMKQMAAEMQRELETTRTELRRGILELPQETAESTAQMRRVIVDQIEALAELNRIVARHGRSLDAAEPVRREAEPLFAAGGGRAPARPVRADAVPPPPQAPAVRDITGAPTRRGNPPNLSPVQGGKDDNAQRNGGWLSDPLTRASRDDSQPIAPPGGREPSRGEERPQRESIDSIDSLSVDIARMIDHEAAAELWERYKRGERGAFTRRLYTQPGQKAFDEIRNKYRSDPEFRQTVEHYIHEFERLLDDVSRGDRGPAVARNYLISDTGKVYTMLAHAAGRFD